MFDDAEIRYHFPDEVDLDPGEPLILEKQLTGTSEFVQCGVSPNGVRNMESIRAFVRHIALAHGGEAWRAVTERGEVLCAYSVCDLADELRGAPAEGAGKSVITMHPHDQFCLALARVRMGVSVGDCWRN